MGCQRSFQVTEQHRVGPSRAWRGGPALVWSTPFACRCSWGPGSTAGCRFHGDRQVAPEPARPRRALPGRPDQTQRGGCSRVRCVYLWSSGKNCFQWKFSNIYKSRLNSITRKANPLSPIRLPHASPLFIFESKSPISNHFICELLSWYLKNTHFFFFNRGLSLAAYQIKDPAWSPLWLKSLLLLGFHPWSGCCKQSPKVKNKKCLKCSHNVITMNAE